MTSPPTVEHADIEPSESPSRPAASDAREVDARAARATPLRRKPRQRAKRSPQRDQAILDPWK
jgi:hypothetical protein